MLGHTSILLLSYYRTRMPTSGRFGEAMLHVALEIERLWKKDSAILTHLRPSRFDAFDGNDLMWIF